VDVTLRPAYSLINSEFNEFLFASIGDEENGMSLSVISALTRLGFDPWEQAARLAALPLGVAASTLAPMIARLPAVNWGASDATSIAARLVALLPKRRIAAPSGTEGRRDTVIGSTVVGSRAALWVLCFFLAAAGLIGLAVNGELPWNRAHVSAPVSDSLSPPQSK
jgi:hypothetical protein